MRKSSRNKMKKEYQKLKTENVRYKEVLQKEQERLQKGEKLKQYWEQKRLYYSLQHQEQQKLLTKPKHSHRNNICNNIYENTDYINNSDHCHYFTRKRIRKRKEGTTSDEE